MTPRRLLRRINRGELANIRFEDFTRLVGALGFQLHRRRGSHRVYVHPPTGEVLVLQPGSDGDAKPYQVRQLRRTVEQYALSLED
jgi:predicted RNA binding protein YcfA (HicA-like mRNA interferase family)